MAAIISIIIVLASVLLVAVVFVQNPKGGGLSTDFGAAHQIGGVKRTNEFIDKATWVLAVVVVVGSIGLTIVNNSSKPKQPKQEQQQQQQNPAQGQQGGQNQGNPAK